MDIFERIQQHAAASPQQLAICSGSYRLSWKELERYSDALAIQIHKWEKAGILEEKEPIAVYGHKHPYMIVCFLACVKSGHAYCPIDQSLPAERIRAILEMLPGNLILCPEEKEGGEDWTDRMMNYSSLHELFEQAEKDPEKPDPAWCLGEKDVYYMIFTSGSTGVPKGVQITRSNLEHYLDWSECLGNRASEKQGKVFLNQAPFSFDLSVMDLYTCLVCGGILYCLEKGTQADYPLLIQALADSQASIWVSTPSFAELCLADPKFTEVLMPQLQVFLFCGETLSCQLVRRLRKRFPSTRIVNTYGPTESTVAVTEVEIADDMLESGLPLPVGRAKPGTRIEIQPLSREGDGIYLTEEADITEKTRTPEGEILILGDTVSPGYYGMSDQTKRAFFLAEDGTRGYHTGDKGYLQDGMLYYCGRMDYQIKLHGYRIELGDVENNIRRLPGIEQTAVLPRVRKDKITGMLAYVTLKQDDPIPGAEKDGILRQQTACWRNQLAKWLPEYMIPKKFIVLNQLPMTANGKTDRKALALRKD